MSAALARRAPRHAAALALCFLSIGGCEAATDVNRPRYHAEDLSFAGAEVDPARIVGDDAFNVTQIASAPIQAYLERTHHGSRSFLADYRGGACGDKAWCTAAEGVADAASRHRISPSVLLGMSEIVGQLLSETSYPREAARVEFVFGCGCNSSGCAASEGSYSRQIDCMASELRSAFDTADTQSFVSQDGVSVRDPNRGTVAVYSVVKEFGRGRGGAWALSKIVGKIKVSVGQ